MDTKEGLSRNIVFAARKEVSGGLTLVCLITHEYNETVEYNVWYPPRLTVRSAGTALNELGASPPPLPTLH